MSCESLGTLHGIESDELRAVVGDGLRGDDFRFDGRMTAAEDVVASSGSFG